MKPRPILYLLPFLPVAMAQGREVSLRTLCLEPVPGLTELWLTGSGGKSVMVPIYENSLSAVIAAKIEGDRLEFFGSDPRKDRSEPVATVRLSDSARQMLLFLPRDEAPEDAEAAEGESSAQDEGDDRDGYVVRAFDDEVEGFSLGRIRLINAAPIDIRFTMAGELQETIPSDGNLLVTQPEGANDYGMYPVVMEYLQDEDTWSRGYAASWRTSDRRREIVVTTIDARFGQPIVKVFSDIPSWLAE